MSILACWKTLEVEAKLSNEVITKLKKLFL